MMSTDSEVICEVFGLKFSRIVRDELIAQVTREPIAKAAGSRIIFTANVDHIVHLQRDPKLRLAYGKAWVVTADGMPVFLYAKMRGAGLSMRVTGADLISGILSSLSPQDHRCFFVASSNETASLLVASLMVQGFDRASIDFVVPYRGFENDVAYSRNLGWRIHTHAPTHLFVGVGAPKSEIWVYENREVLGDCYVLCAGAGLDFFAGTEKRAPRILQRLGFEWLWRFSHNPRRLWRRYFIDSWSFIIAVAQDVLHHG